MTAVALPHRTDRSARTRAAEAVTDTDSRAADESTSLVVRRVNLRPVASIAFIVLLGAAVLGVGAAVAIWTILHHLGVVDHVERLMVDLGFDTFQLRGEPLLRAVAIGAALTVVAGTVVVVLATALFNLVSRLVGGLSMRVVQRPLARRRSPRPQQPEPVSPVNLRVVSGTSTLQCSTGTRTESALPGSGAQPRRS